MTRLLILGLTGSIGMGKSTVAAMFREHGVPVFDADAQVRMLQGPGGALLGPIERAFPGSTGPAGVNRDMLGAQVFGNDAALCPGWRRSCIRPWPSGAPPFSNDIVMRR